MDNWKRIEIENWDEYVPYTTSSDDCNSFIWELPALSLFPIYWNYAFNICPCHCRNTFFVTCRLVHFRVCEIFSHIVRFVCIRLPRMSRQTNITINTQSNCNSNALEPHERRRRCCAYIYDTTACIYVLQNDGQLCGCVRLRAWLNAGRRV